MCRHTSLLENWKNTFHYTNRKHVIDVRSATTLKKVSSSFIKSVEFRLLKPLSVPAPDPTHYAFYCAAMSVQSECGSVTGTKIGGRESRRNLASAPIANRGPPRFYEKRLFFFLSRRSPMTENNRVQGTTLFWFDDLHTRVNASRAADRITEYADDAARLSRKRVF